MLLVLPQTLLIGDIIIEKTAFTLKRETVKPLPTGGRIRMSGRIKGYVNGVIDGEFIGVIDGEMGAVVRARDNVERIDPYAVRYFDACSRHVRPGCRGRQNL